jgi:hypothetical protein
MQEELASAFELNREFDRKNRQRARFDERAW